MVIPTLFSIFAYMKEFEQWQVVRCKIGSKIILAVYQNLLYNFTHSVWDGEKEYILEDEDIELASEEETKEMERKLDSIFADYFKFNFGMTTKKGRAAKKKKAQEMSDFELLAAANE